MYVNAKMIPVEILGIRGGGLKERNGEGKFKYVIFDTM
jgi:hypothetical protein